MLALTMGDPNGIGAEVLIRALKIMLPYQNWRPLVFGDFRVMEQINQRLGGLISLCPLRDIQHMDEAAGGVVSDQNTIQVYDPGVPVERDWRVGRCNAWGGASAFAFFTEAIAWVKTRQYAAIVTAPLHKEALRMAGHDFPGHTEILSRYTSGERPVMMLASDQLRAVMVTLHMGLREAVGWLNPERVLEVIQITHRGLRAMGFANPRLGVAGLNPHAGENGLFGTEEKDIIEPAINAAKKAGIRCEGPLSPDTIFLRHREGEFDVVVAMYHDQALIPLKLVGFGRSVNVTLGLPVLRTSVDHGTAFDRAERLDSDPNSMIAAIEMALWLLRKKR